MTMTLMVVMVMNSIISNIFYNDGEEQGEEEISYFFITLSFIIILSWRWMWRRDEGREREDGEGEGEEEEEKEEKVILTS